MGRSNHAADRADPHQHVAQRPPSDLRQRHEQQTVPRVWDPVARTFTDVPDNDTANLFCAGHTPLADGRYLVVEGHVDAYVGLKNATIFDPATNTWSRRQADGERPVVSDPHPASRRPHARRVRLQRLPGILLGHPVRRTPASLPHRRSSILRPTTGRRSRARTFDCLCTPTSTSFPTGGSSPRRPRRRRSRAGSSTSRPRRGAWSTATSATAPALSCTCRGRSSRPVRRGTPITRSRMRRPRRG